MLRSTLSKGTIPPHHSLRKCYRKTDNFFLQSASKLMGDLAEAVANLQSIPELQGPDLALLHGIDGKPGSFGKAAANESIVAHCNILLTSWRGVIMESLTHRRVISAEVGPSITHPFETPSGLHGRPIHACHKGSIGFAWDYVILHLSRLQACAYGTRLKLQAGLNMPSGLWMWVATR